MPSPAFVTTFDSAAHATPRLHHFNGAGLRHVRSSSLGAHSGQSAVLNLKPFRDQCLLVHGCRVPSMPSASSAFSASSASLSSTRCVGIALFQFCHSALLSCPLLGPEPGPRTQCRGRGSHGAIPDARLGCTADCPKRHWRLSLLWLSSQLLGERFSASLPAAESPKAGGHRFLLHQAG